MTFDDKAPTISPELLIELLGVVPRLVERTRSQAEFARSLASMLPCVGALMPARPTADDPAGAPEHENVDVLSVLAEDSPPDPAVMEHTAGVEVIGASPRPVTVGPEADPVRTKAITTDTTPPPDEADLPIQDYDSLAASQVVPRLSTLGHDELRAVQAYESAHRRRQTILNRVDQLLAS